MHMSSVVEAQTAQGEQTVFFARFAVATENVLFRDSG
jgi:hypothetical protein